MRTPSLVLFSLLVLLTSTAVAQVCDVRTPGMVTVIVDMDASRDGCQSTVKVFPGTSVVEGVAVYVLDPTQSHEMWAMGYYGGLDRGLAFGHTPTNLHQGTVTSIVGTPGVAVHPDNVGFIQIAPVFQPGFVGPEVQYLEGGASAGATISAEPEGPIFTVDIHLENATDKDVFAFHVLDMVTVWTSGTNGVFSTQDPFSLDTGGDAVPDGTPSLYGVDADAGIAVPPAAFQVDYVDGPAGGGPAAIEVLARIPTDTRSWSTLKTWFGSR